jgi:D-serine deaminase-like pyridoxal phosphate-dependent protein
VSRSDGAVDADIATRFPVGMQLRVLPNHACATAAQFPNYFAIKADDADARVQEWPRFYGW